MGFRILLLCIFLLPGFAGAEIYKWKDKDGHMRYSDVPPPSNIKQESLYGKKIPKPTGQPALAPVEGDITKDLEKANEKVSADKKPLSKEEAASKRAKDAEQQKKEDEAKEADLKASEENCKSARANFKTFQEGGRIFKRNEQGEREYMSDGDITAGKEKAQADIDKYCN